VRVTLTSDPTRIHASTSSGTDLLSRLPPC
jgi:hypothetical protein